jgi:urease beta subunit
MKNRILLLTVFISTVPFVCDSQVIDKTRSDTLQYQISYTNYCLNKHRKEKLYGIASQFVGSAIIAVFHFDELNGMNRLEEKFKIDYAAAGDRLDLQATTLRKFERDQDDILYRKKVSLIAGSVFILGGVFLQIDSYKWLKRAYLKPGEIGIVIEF